MTRKKTTTEVAEQVNMSRQYLLTYISRHPELRPAENITGAWFWSGEEIQRLVDFRASKRRGRPKKK
jgi:hypothetical protein